MNQEAFEARYREHWDAFDAWLASRNRPARAAQPVPPGPALLPDDEVPRRYRALCQHLALARDRGYSSGLVDRLQRLVMRGHQYLYGARPEAGPKILRFFVGGFPRAVRAASGPVMLSAALFFGPLIGLAVALQAWPDFIYTLLPADQVSAYQEMYDPASRTPGRRGADADTQMLGFYVWNNVRIGFQTFAGGVLFGTGAIFFLVFNGVAIGAVAGHLLQIGYGTPFLSFVSGHSALELIAIVLMGAAGLRLGGALVSPGRRSRADALRASARAAVPVVAGAATMLVFAAFVEAFWSPLTAVPPPIKYAVGIGFWAIVVAYFALAGRDRHAA